METQTQVLTRKRGGAKYGGVHLAMLIASTLLLTLAAVFLVMEMNVLGVIVMLLGIAVRALDTRL